MTTSSTPGDGHCLKTYTEQDDGAALALAPGAAFQIRLPENPMAGYRWFLGEWDRTILELTHDQFHPPGAAGYGAGGEHQWVFAARAPGRTSVQLIYRRRWEADTPARTFTLRISVSTP